KPTAASRNTLQATMLAISRDGTTLAVYQHDAHDKNSASALSMFALSRGEPALLLRRCEPARLDRDRLSLNADGSTLAIECSMECRIAGNRDADPVVFHRWSPASRKLEREPEVSRPWSTQTLFDARQPQFVLFDDGLRMSIVSRERPLRHTVSF